MNSRDTIIEKWYQLITNNKANENTLFGRSYHDDSIYVINKVINRQGFVLYAEIPLIGEPYLDLTVSKIEIKREENDKELGFSDLLDYQRSLNIHNFAFEFDLSKGNKDNPHIVIFLPMNMKINKQYLDNTLNYFKCEYLSDNILKFIDNLPSNYYLAYFGSYRKREEKPFRLTVKIKDTLRYCKDKNLFKKELETLGYHYFNNEMYQIFNLFFQNNETLEICFDMNDDGTFADVIGLQCGTSAHKKGEISAKHFESFNNMKYLTKFEEMRLIDDRYRKIIDSIYTNEDLSIIHNIHTIKIKYKDGKMLAPKIYTEFSCRNLKIN